MDADISQLSPIHYAYLHQERWLLIRDTGSMDMTSGAFLFMNATPQPPIPDFNIKQGIKAEFTSHFRDQRFIGSCRIHSKWACVYFYELFVPSTTEGGTANGPHRIWY